MKALIRICSMLALLAAAAASADIVTTHRVQEVELRDVRLPATANGVLSFKTCSECDLISLRASAGTQYILNGKSVELAEMRMAVMRAMQRNGDSIVGIKHALANDALVYVNVAL